MMTLNGDGCYRNGMPGTVEAALMDALRLHKQERPELALPAIQRLTMAYPNDFRVWWALANISGRRDEKRAALMETLRLNPGLDEAREMLDRLNGGPGPAF